MSKQHNTDYKSLVYIAICSEENSPGVAKKIKGFVNGAKYCGIVSKYIFLRPGSIKIYFYYFCELLKAKEDIIITRYQSTTNIILILAGCFLLLKRKKFILDIPTPITNLIKEILSKEKVGIKDYLIILQLMILGPITLFFTSIIIEYANESKWFSLLVNNKIIKLGNGIDVNSIPLRVCSPEWPTNKIVLVGVGTVAVWHGYDRIIKVIKILKDDIDYSPNIEFRIIGDGPEINNLKKLVNDLDLAREVIFTGMLYGNKLISQYELAHFGIGSLAWKRVGVEEASPLQITEYLAVRLPVITATKDPDFNDNLPFYFNVSEEEEIDSVKELFKQFRSIELSKPIDCRIFAEERLDFNVKINKIINYANL